MCGILGVSIVNKAPLKQDYKKWVKELFLLSESRGKEASGFALCNGTQLRYLKTPFPASDMVKSKVFNKEIDGLIDSGTETLTVIGHSRLVTNGYEHHNINN
ncbi:MAG TPA: hypothetical protein VNJ07_14350, partial [Chitinophagales bacterium]|nr:hypothetical protein [Chitinophagales bacterium]